MPLPVVKMNFEGIALIGTKGSTAGTALTNCRDIKLAITTERGDTTVRGDSLSPPIKTENVTARMAAIELTMLHDTTDASFTTMSAAAANGTAIAVRTKAHATGLGYDGDCTLEKDAPMPLAGEQVVTFTCYPNRDDRVPQLNV